VSTRLDIALVARGLARSRGHADALVAAGRVVVAGRTARRRATPIEDHEDLVVRDDPDDAGYASRAAYKLAGALDAWGPTGPAVSGRYCLDLGASTGGFTDVLLRRGAAHVVALDVGHGQLIDRIAADPRVEVREGVNARELSAGDLSPAPGLVVADLSFISLTLVLPAVVPVVARPADLVLLVKPQFEVGRDRLGPGGVVRDRALHRVALDAVLRCAGSLGLAVRGVRASTLPGPAGNLEYPLWLSVGGPQTLVGAELDALLDRVVGGGA
jgi:23S rRNA (cytidine1920-2'-O)/16S rRNA (cytidine1409-2'-O)-methyltransferase